VIAVADQARPVREPMSATTLHRPGAEFPLQMGSALLPPATDTALLKRRLYDEHRVEVPIIEWSNRILLRVSVQGYNDGGDALALLASLRALL
jgi:hypothetical protein